MKTALEWMKAHPLASFFGLTLVLVYLLLSLLASTGQRILQVPVLYSVRLGVYAAVLVGMPISGWFHAERSRHLPLNAALRS